LVVVHHLNSVIHRYKEHTNMKDYLGFKKWYNANKDEFKDEESSEKIAWAAWSAAKIQEKKKRDDSEPGFYLEVD